MSKLYEIAKDIARELIDDEGSSPDLISVEDECRLYAFIKGLRFDEGEELEALVWRLLGAAVTTITFPDEGEL